MQPHFFRKFYQLHVSSEKVSITTKLYVLFFKGHLSKAVRDLSVKIKLCATVVFFEEVTNKLQMKSKYLKNKIGPISEEAQSL